jgi:F-type H+-transporting ATPase subunit gamma
VPSLIDMRRRIRAVKSTQQITKAMKMVAASKLRRAQDRVVATRPFAREARRALASIAARVGESRHPLLADRTRTSETGAVLLIVVTSDRGLCGSFNTNAIKAAGAFLREHAARPVSLGLVGRKGRDFFIRRGLPVRFQHVNLPKVITFADAEAIAAPAIEDYTDGRVDRVFLLYNEFKSVIQQRLVVEPLLPIAPASAEEIAEAGATDYLYEPSAERILAVLLERLVQAQVLRALVESNAAFFAAQMTAMDAATRNSADMIEALTLTMNKVRQAAITREIIEVVSGAGARAV